MGLLPEHHIKRGSRIDFGRSSSGIQRFDPMHIRQTLFHLNFDAFQLETFNSSLLNCSISESCRCLVEQIGRMCFEAIPEHSLLAFVSTLSSI